ncbi:MAG: hypothetical protein AAF722_03405 [Cyanobacteria bacterium P01_C01_bin.70]
MLIRWMLWTLSDFCHRGIASPIIRMLLKQLPGQHVYWFTDEVPELSAKLDFEEPLIG